MTSTLSCISWTSSLLQRRASGQAAHGQEGTGTIRWPSPVVNSSLGFTMVSQAGLVPRGGAPNELLGTCIPKKGDSFCPFCTSGDANMQHWVSPAVPALYYLWHEISDFVYYVLYVLYYIMYYIILCIGGPWSRRDKWSAPWTWK